ncbi:ankyrin repeat-containing domain protein [Stachybotrys elegans]|uniref:Ankyrin repeat-containing domain protein n=1 Tax=Stachybotrys elegans TaxID=80388 RepID=A0A8K0T1P4_9HYPO|nr:ankyrin repeat-containing domain protein [Stachybotrys elegans]
MDPLSISASIAGLVSLADLVYRSTRTFITRAKVATKEVEALSSETKSLSIVLHALSHTTFDLEVSQEDQSDGKNRAQDAKYDHLYDCQQTLSRLEKALEKPMAQLSSNSRLGRVQGRLKWPFSSSDTTELLHDIQRHKQTLDLAVSADTLAKLKMCLSRQDETKAQLNDIYSLTQKVLNTQTKMELDERRRKILDYFSKISPDSEYQTNRQLRHPLSGLWLTKGPDFDKWYNTPGSRIWFSGIPGAGKSVLAAGVVEECLERNAQATGTAVAYFFCAYRDERTHEAVSILSSLCSQLAMQGEDCFQILEDFYNRLKTDRLLSSAPPMSSLIKAMNKMCGLFNRVYLIIDGLDECLDHTQDTVQSLMTFVSSQTDEIVSIAFSSRDEVFIREELQQFPHVEIEAHTEDIRHYVLTELDQRIASRKLRLRDLTLKDHITTRLVTGAKGMFRWVACQLDYLCELLTDRARKEALEKLPPTLPAVYERILLRLEDRPERFQQIVRTTLLLLSFPNSRMLSPLRICEAVSLQHDTVTLYEDDIVEEEEILRLCSSLVRKSKYRPCFEFAHFTVQEFLEQSCSSHPVLEKYAVSLVKAKQALATICLRYLILKDHEHLPEATEQGVASILERIRDRPLYEFAAINWPWLASEITSDVEVSTLLRQLFQQPKTPNFSSWAIEVIRHCLVQPGKEAFYFWERADLGRSLENAAKIISAVLRPDFTPLHMAAALGLTDVCRELLHNGAPKSLRSEFGTPLQCALASFAVFADVAISDDRTYNIGELNHNQGARRETVQLFLQAECQIDLQLSTPFQLVSTLSLPAITSYYGDGLEVVVDLIKAGIAVCDTDVACFRRRYSRIMTNWSPEKFKEFFEGDSGIASLLEALSGPGEEGSPKGRLFTETLNFSRSMKLDCLSDKKSTYAVEGTSPSEIRSYALSLIKTNDVLQFEPLLGGIHSELVSSIGIDPSRPSWSPIHLAVASNALDVLLSMLKHGLDHAVITDDGLTPVQLCWEDQDADALQALLNHGASTTICDDEGMTIWHSASTAGSTMVMRLLLGLDEKEEALQMRSEQGRTPICEALASGHENIVLDLLEHCHTASFWGSNLSIFRGAASMKSPKVVRALLEMGMEIDGLDDDPQGNPLHSLNVRCSIECVNLLKDSFPLEQRRLEDGRTPLELLISRAAKEGVVLDSDIIEAMVPESAISNAKEGQELWCFVCKYIAIYHESNGLQRIANILVKFKIHEYFEQTRCIPALVPLAEEICRDTLDMHKTVLNGDENPPKYVDWSKISAAIHFISTNSGRWDMGSNDPSLVRLLSEAILHDDHATITLLISHGINLHSTIDQLSPFELACTPEINISTTTYEYLLEQTTVDQINDTTSLTCGLGFLHLTAGFCRSGGAYNKLEKLLAKGENCDLPLSATQATPLLHHILADAVDTANLLLDWGADPWRMDCQGYDAALGAAFRGHLPLLQKIAIKVQIGQSDGYWSRHINAWGANALHLAAARGHVDCLQFYLDQNLLSNIDCRDATLETPMHYAAENDQHSTIDFLVRRGGNIDATDCDGWTPLHTAAHFGSLDTVRRLINLGAKYKVCHAGCSPLALAFQAGHENVAEVLQSSFQAGFDPEAVVTSPRVLRSLAVALEEAIWSRDIAMCKRIHAMGCPMDVDIGTGLPLTPLALVVDKGDLEIVRWLLENGAIVSTKLRLPNWGQANNALERAMCFPAFNPILPEMIHKYLQEVGHLATLRIRPAVDSGNTEGLEILLEKLHEAKKQHHQLSNFNQMVNGIFLGDGSRSSLDSPLHIAAIRGDLRTCQLLMQYGATVDVLTDVNVTPLHCAAQSNSASVVQFLLDCGASPYSRDNYGYTPIMQAYLVQSRNAMKTLASVSKPEIDGWGRSPIHLICQDASESNRHDVVAFGAALREPEDLCLPDIHGLCAMHWLINSYSPRYLCFLLNTDSRLLQMHHIPPWPDCMSAYTDAFFASNTSLSDICANLRLLKRYCTKQEMHRVLGMGSPGDHSLFCWAAGWGAVKAIEKLAIIEPDLVKHRCRTHGTPLSTALLRAQFEAVRAIVRLYDLYGMESWKELLNSTPLHDSRLIRWHFVGRFLERRMIANRAGESSEDMKPWSGPRVAEVPLKWEWRKRHTESILEYASRRRKIVSRLRGVAHQRLTLI